MKFYATTLLIALGTPSAISFQVGSNIQHNYIQNVTPKTMQNLPIHALHMANDGDDFYADYDPSKYEQREQRSSYSNDSGGDRRSSSYGERGRGRGGGRGGGRGAGPSTYSRDTSRDTSNVDENAVMNLIQQRNDARRSRDFDAADSIRQDLVKNYSVGIDDREGTWRTGVSDSGSGQKFGGGGVGRGGRGGRGSRDGGRGGRGGRGERSKPKDYLGPNGHDYVLSEDSGQNNSIFSEPEIHGLLADRLQAKFSRDFRTADRIQMTLIDGGVFVHDGMKEWRGDGIPYESFDGRDRSGGSGREGPKTRDVYARSPHSADVEGVQDSLIDRLLMERTKFKMMHEYDKADAVREGLRNKFNVLVDDRLKQWSVGGDFGEEHNAQREMASAFASRGYIKSSSSMPLDEEEEEYIQHHIDTRVQAKKDRNFEQADDIRNNLAQRFDVTIDDKMKLWSVGGVFEESGGKVGKPRGLYVRRGGGDLSEDDENHINKMLLERYKAKKQRDYDTADQIRNELMSTFNIRVDDRSNEWRVDTDDYAMAGENSLSEEDVAFIDSKLKERFACKRVNEYEAADAIRDELGLKFGVSIDDRTKEWAVMEQRNERIAISDEDDDNDEDEDEDDREDDLDEALEAVLNDLEEADTFEEEIMA